MTFTNKKIEKEIERYYFISQIINKYGKIFLIITLSFLYILFNNTDFNVFAFTTNKLKDIWLVDIQWEKINVRWMVFDKENISKINKQLSLSGLDFKVIWSDITFKEINQDKKKIKKLSYNIWLVKTKDNIVLPISLSQNINNIYKINSVSVKDKYKIYHNIIVTSTIDSNIHKVKIKNSAIESLDSLYKKYNTYCMKDSILKITNYFCDKNIKNMMDNLYNHNMKKEDYRKLFTAFSANIDNESLCKKAVKIAEYQTNFENIEWMINLYCDEDTKSSFKMAEDVYRLAYTNSSSSNISNDDVRKMYFMRIEKEIYSRKTLAIEDITNFLENVKSIVRHRPIMFKNDPIFSDELAVFIGKNLLKEIENKVDANETDIKKVKRTVSNILDGESINGDMLWLLAYTNIWLEDQLANSFQPKVHGSGIISFKEKVTYYLSNNENIFEKTAFKVDQKKQLALAKWILKLKLIDDGKVINKNIWSTLWLKADNLWNISIVKIKLDDAKLEKYISSLNLNIKGKSLKLINSIYSEKLIYPILYNNYGNNLISACANIKWCKDNKINNTIRWNSELGAFSIKVTYSINNAGKITSINIIDKEFTIKDKEWKYNIDINLNSIENKLNNIIKNGDFRFSNIKGIENKISSLVANKVLNTLKKDSLSISDINKLKYNFKTYLNIIPDNYKKSKDPNKAFVWFTLNNIRFTSIVNIKTNEIEKLFVYKPSKKENILIKNTNLKFSSAYDENLTLLKLDTINYIKKTDSKAYDTYIDKK